MHKYILGVASLAVMLVLVGGGCSSTSPTSDTGDGAVMEDSTGGDTNARLQMSEDGDAVVIKDTLMEAQVRCPNTGNWRCDESVNTNPSKVNGQEFQGLNVKWDDHKGKAFFVTVSETPLVYTKTLEEHYQKSLDSDKKYNKVVEEFTFDDGKGMVVEQDDGEGPYYGYRAYKQVGDKVYSCSGGFTGGMAALDKSEFDALRPNFETLCQSVDAL